MVPVVDGANLVAGFSSQNRRGVRAGTGQRRLMRVIDAALDVSIAHA